MAKYSNRDFSMIIADFFEYCPETFSVKICLKKATFKLRKRNRETKLK